MSDNEKTQPPHTIEAEQMVLGALLSNNDLLQKITGLLEPHHFFDPLHAQIYEMCVDRINSGTLASPVTLAAALEGSDGLKALGGPSYLARLVGGATATYAIRDYATLIVDAWAKRGLVDVSEEIVAQITDGRKPAADISLAAESRLGELVTNTTSRPLFYTHLSMVTKAVKSVLDIYEGVSEPGVMTGIRPLDEKLNGLRPGQMIVIGGRPSMGKTTLGQNIAYNATAANHGVYFASLEMTAEEIGTRFLSLGLTKSGIRIPYSKMRRPDGMTEDDMRAIVEEAKRQEATPLVVGERDVRHMDRLRQSIRRAQQHMADTPVPLSLVVVDYIQLIQNKHERSYDRVSAASDTLKSLAMELNVPVVAMSQLSRSVEMRDPPRPMLSDIRESGKLEEDADVVMFTYREDYYLRKQLDADDGHNIEKTADLQAQFDRARGVFEIIIDKQRGGATGTVQAFADLAACAITDDRAGYKGNLI